MFTGIIEEIGTIKSVSNLPSGKCLEINCSKVLEDTKIGDSICVNGVCQTVTKLSPETFCAELSSETLNVTNFSTIKAGDKVNLERALQLNSRLGGHIVSGHTDCTAKLIDIRKENEFSRYYFEVNNAKYIVKKGSVTINGISLTVADVTSNTFSVALIPHTLKNTTLLETKCGETVNIEFDILSKYVEKFLSRNDNKTIDENFLKENGFI